MDHVNHLQELGARIERLGEAIPAEMGAFGSLHEAGATERALSVKTRELIALAVAIAVHCDGCIDYHVHDAIQVGATRDEVADAIGVAVLMGGGPSVVYGSTALEAYDELSAAG